jgi:hypothetical protein
MLVRLVKAFWRLSIASVNASVYFLTSISLRLKGLFLGSLALVNRPCYGEMVRCE